MSETEDKKCVVSPVKTPIKMSARLAEKRQLLQQQLDSHPERESSKEENSDDLAGSKPGSLSETKIDRRRRLALQRKEDDKKKTIDKVLRKLQPRGGRARNFRASRNKSEPMIRYVKNQKGNFLCLPETISLADLYGDKSRPSMPVDKTDPQLHDQQQCGVHGCTNGRKYSCSKTGVPLCSLQCYRKNLSVANMEKPEDGQSQG